MTIQIFNQKILSALDDPMEAVGIDFFTFGGGEESVRIDKHINGGFFAVVAKITSSTEFMRLLLISEALEGASYKKLILPYMPYARQDRRCNSGEAHSLKVVAQLINMMGWDEVVIADPHSDVVEALVDRCRIIRQWEVMNSSDDLAEFIRDENTILVSPDAGALKKIYKVAEEFGKTEILKVDKRRDLSTGAILGVEIHDAVDTTRSGKKHIIVDDICDGGRTFTVIAEELNKYGVTDIALFVTHGIFSKGIGPFQGKINQIWTTNSWFDRMLSHHGDVDVNFIDITDKIIKGDI